MRASLLALLCAGCSLGNRVDESRLPVGQAIEVCDDGEDNDGDGDLDCEDSNCRSSVLCETSDETCCDGADNDGDGSSDCDELSCSAAPCCREATEESCSDHQDNDRDGLIDCLEPDCKDFAYCGEGTDQACQDRIDNDGDGRVDCHDESCYDRFVCFPRSPRERDAPCEERRPALRIEDGFDGAAIDETTWEIFQSGPRDRPSMAAGGGLDVNGRDGYETAGVASQERVGVGAEQPFDMMVTLVPEGPLDDPGYELRIELHTRREWRDRMSDGGPLLGWVVAGTASQDVVRLGCVHHGGELQQEGSGEVAVSAGSPLTLLLHGDKRTGELEYSLDGVVLCRQALQPIEPQARLVLHGSGAARDGAPTVGHRLLVDGLVLDVEQQRPPERCRGLRTPVMPDGFCEPGRIDVLGQAGPGIAWTGGDSYAYHLFYQAHHTEVHREIAHVVSDDGRSGWEMEPLDRPAFEPADYSDWKLGAVRYDAEHRRFEAWVRYGDLPGFYTTSVHAPGALPESTGWTSQGRLTVESGAGAPAVDAMTWVPEAVVRDDEGYLGWCTARGRDGRDGVYLARSEDGQDWTLEPEPVLEGGEVGAWDSAGASAPSVTEADGWLLLAYESRAFGVPAAIGLAASADGVSWLKHGDNPLVRGEEPDLDLDGAGEPAVLWQPGVVRVWYTAELYRLEECMDAPSTGLQRRLGLAELRFPEE